MLSLKKKDYTPAEMEIITLEICDILTVSGGDSGDNTDYPGVEDDPNVDVDW